jgi:hypothetical protein
MNVDIALVNRALQAIGQAPISEADRTANNSTWLTAKDYYLDTMLESLEEVEWTSAKRRRELIPAGMPIQDNAEFSFAYNIPIDCAKPIELDDNEPYRIEADILYTDAKPARLLYVSNGKRFVTPTGMDGGGAQRGLSAVCISGGTFGRGRRFETGDVLINGGDVHRTPPAPPPEASEDFPEYNELHLEANFYLYWVNLLASKYAIKLTDKPDLSTTFFQKASAIGAAAKEDTIVRSAPRKKAKQTWAEELGLS